jgi:hypothetical protein
MYNEPCARHPERPLSWQDDLDVTGGDAVGSLKQKAGPGTSATYIIRIQIVHA